MLKKHENELDTVNLKLKPESQMKKWQNHYIQYDIKLSETFLEIEENNFLQNFLVFLRHTATQRPQQKIVSILLKKQKRKGNW